MKRPDGGCKTSFLCLPARAGGLTSFASSCDKEAITPQQFRGVEEPRYIVRRKNCFGSSEPSSR